MRICSAQAADDRPNHPSPPRHFSAEQIYGSRASHHTIAGKLNHGRRVQSRRSEERMRGGFTDYTKQSLPGPRVDARFERPVLQSDLLRDQRHL